MIREILDTPLSPARKADLINAQTRAQLAAPLWQAALGGKEPGATGMPGRVTLPSTASLIAMLARQDLDAFPLGDPDAVQAADMPATAPTPQLGSLGANAVYGDALQSAADRTGIPAAALASIVDAEAAKDAQGRWNPMSRNSRSSAAGLGQFLNRTWIDEAEKSGTWLNTTVRAKGWLTDKGKVDPAHRSDVLAMRYDGEASINAVADYARGNLRYLEARGVPPGATTENIARTAYLAHQLGPADASRFLRGGLSDERARTLLVTQLGDAAAQPRIQAQGGDAARAHRAWLVDYLEQHVQPEHFSA